jgi:hypothetical protein
MITETYKPEILVRFWDEDIDSTYDFEDAFSWAMDGGGCGTLEDEEVEKINKHYEKVKDNLTHNDMKELLTMTMMRHCEWDVLSEHYIKVKI